MLCVGIGMRLVTVGLSCLCQQNKRGSIGGLETEGEIEQDKGVDIELGIPKSIQQNPYSHDDGLPNEKNRGSKKAGESLCF